jgi:hypothetical protein
MKNPEYIDRWDKEPLEDITARELIGNIIALVLFIGLVSWAGWKVLTWLF